MICKRYVGIPYKAKEESLSGCDCWGLVKLIYKQVMGINITSPDYNDPMNRLEINGVANKHKTTYRKIDYDKRKAGDIILFNILGLTTHCGFILDDQKMIHTQKATNSVIEDYTRSKWISRIEGIYRPHC